MVDYCLQDVHILLSAVQVAVHEDLNLWNLTVWQSVTQLLQKL